MPRPRGRPRIVRPRLSRMDAAVDAMLPLGFPEQRVKKHVKQLLKVYGGDEGWPFIEADSYRVLLDYIIEERDDEEQVTQNGCLMEPKSPHYSQPVENQRTTPISDKPRGDEEPGCIGASETQKDIVLSDVVKSPSAAVAETAALPASSPPQDSTPLLLPPANRQTRFPCFGWIESDEDDTYEFIDLAPMAMATGERATLNVTMWRKKRRSRWDVKPCDP